VLHNQSRDPAHLMCAKATIGHERYRLQPEFGHRPLPLHMDVRRFPTVGAEEDEIVRSITKYSRHRAALFAHIFPDSEERLYAEQKKVATDRSRTPAVSRARKPEQGVGCRASAPVP
jgi:hypothetical protein